MKLTKKLTSLLLAMTLALSLAAVSVSAADDKDDKVIVPVDGSMLMQGTLTVADLPAACRLSSWR